MDDEYIVCATCQTVFAFTAGEREWYAARGYFPPRHCPMCRQRRKELREQAEAERAAERPGE